MRALETVNTVIGIIFMICYAYQLLYMPLVWLLRNRKEKKETRVKIHEYAALICARNEETVITDLIESLKNQTYPKEHLHIFVMADNCTDETASLSRKAGATVYERHDNVHVGKGYALDALLNHIRKDYGDKYDGYFVFDADNILKDTYVEEMNKTFSEGHEIITSYRNSKNYSSNWISAGYALWFIRDSRYLNYARSLINLSSVVSGTGFLFSKAVLTENGGWPYHSLTEDTEFSVDQILKGRRIGFCEKAELYDEQPVKFRQSWHQRERWAKGCLQVFGMYGKDLVKKIFMLDLSSFDVTMSIMPAFILSTLSVACNIILSLWGAFVGEDILIAVRSIGSMLIHMYMMLFGIGVVTTLTEWNKIHCPSLKKVLYMFTFPVFMFTYIPIAFCSLFRKTTWRPIQHTFSVSELKKQEAGLFTDLKKAG